MANTFADERETDNAGTSESILKLEAFTWKNSRGVKSQIDFGGGTGKCREQIRSASKC